MKSLFSTYLALLSICCAEAFRQHLSRSFDFGPFARSYTFNNRQLVAVQRATTWSTIRFSSPNPDEANVETSDADTAESDAGIADKEEIGNLVEDDEWNGLSMELSEVVRMAVVEDLKRNTRDFLGKDDYKLGDITKEVDTRVKDEVAKLRGKQEYELGDLALALDQLSKDMSCELSGKNPGEYAFGDLSQEVDKRIKVSVESFTGKPYEAGDLTREVSRRVAKSVEEFTGKEYSFGDVSREIDRRRSEWVKDYLGKDTYVFGDITKKAVQELTGKSDYAFGDVTKSVVGKMFGKSEPRGGDQQDA